ncbi:EF-hand domain-containing protein [Roseovarius sp. SCSIO 43702]|uniref:EF-hand domain-containing protein n=1 Tax=Roseovarius sp. SCSIO 43702 TaxID=2823043 RepID=UPI001C73499C|nr:EF-hand domain-containing protein [Roseovarius sp. SCSIO 43702]QYX57487.1 EF-hand domain-containing protein [Roseovarius sp. SCSIO 43702]
MFKQVTAATFVAALALPAFAMEAMDADGDGMVSMDEFNAAMPDAGEDTFTSIDTDGDGMLSADEVEAAKEAGTLPSDG